MIELLEDSDWLEFCLGAYGKDHRYTEVIIPASRNRRTSTTNNGIFVDRTMPSIAVNTFHFELLAV